MGKPALECIKSIVAELRSLHKIPKAYHVDLESRCVILWGKPERKLGTAYGVRERKIVSRERQAQRTYSEVLEENCHILLPFMLAIRPRACKGFVQMHKMIAEYSTFRLDLGTRSKDLLNGMAVKNKFDKNPDYIRFIESLFPAGGDLRIESTEYFELIQGIIKQRGLSENFTCVEFLNLMFPEKYSRQQSITAHHHMAAQTSSFPAIDDPSRHNPVQHRKRRRIEDECVTLSRPGQPHQSQHLPQSDEMDSRWSDADGPHHRDRMQDRGHRQDLTTNSGCDGILPLQPMQTSELASQTGQISRMTQLPSLQQMALVVSSFNRDQAQDRGYMQDSTTGRGYSENLDVDEQRQQPLLCESLYHSSLRYEQQKLAAVGPLPPSKENRGRRSFGYVQGSANEFTNRNGVYVHERTSKQHIEIARAIQKRCPE